MLCYFVCTFMVHCMLDLFNPFRPVLTCQPHKYLSSEYCNTVQDPKWIPKWVKYLRDVCTFMVHCMLDLFTYLHDV